MSVYQELGGGYSYAVCRVGLILKSPAQVEIYVQPGDAESAMLDTIQAFDEISEDVKNHKRAVIVDMALGEYFA